MKTKILLMAAAALAAGVVTSQAQVYSQNVVGYVNTPLTAGQFTLMAPALDNGTNNTISTAVPNPAIGDAAYIFQNGTYVTLNYISKNIGTRTNPNYVTNWFDGSGNQAGDFAVAPGQGFFYQAAVNETNTQVGSVDQGAVTNAFVPSANGFAILSSPLPYAGGLTTALNYQPNIGDVVYLYSNGGYTSYNYQSKNIGTRTNPNYVTNWFDGSGNQNEPIISVGEGFWLNPAASTTWSQVYTNN